MRSASSPRRRRPSSPGPSSASTAAGRSGDRPMRAVLIEAPGAEAAVQVVPDPTPGPHDVVVAVRGCGICGTDRHILEEGLPTASYPLIPGHEPWGEVVAVGREATL